MTFSIKVKFFILQLVFLILFINTGRVFAASKGVIISPTRVIFEDRKRSSVIYIVNPDKKDITYRITLTNIRMNQKGKTEEVLSPTSDEILAKKLIRYAPRQATLAPGERQTIRLMVRKPQKLLDGEYRAHLKVAPVPVTKEKNQRGSAASDNTTHIKIDFLIGVTIPIIIRHGEVNVEVAPRSAVFKKDKKTSKEFLEIELERSGNRSATLDVLAFYLPGPDEKRVNIGQVNGLVIYTPNTNRIVEVPIISLLEDTFHGEIQVVIQNREKQGNNILGFKNFPLQKIFE